MVEADQSQILLSGGCFIGAYSVVVCRNQIGSPFQNSRLVIGDQVGFGEQCNIRATGGEIIIGNQVMIASHVTMAASNHGTELGTPMMDQLWPETARDIVIGSDVWIAAGASLLPGTRIGDGCVVAAGAVVRGIVPPYSFVAGVPAKVIKSRIPRGVMFVGNGDGLVSR
jgi:acetyltransferase-like isoleucine patch superfamily enzyme